MKSASDKNELVIWDMIVIGSGPAGLTAALYAARGGMKVLVLEGKVPGGQLTYTHLVENYPGLVETGFGLVQAMKDQVTTQGVQIEAGYVKQLRIPILMNDQKNVDFSKGSYFTLSLEEEEVYAHTVVIATGSTAKWLDLPGEEKFKGNSISTCATCDGNFFKGQVVGVVGGGNTAVEDALYLSKICKKVILIHRRDKLRAEQIAQNRLAQCSNVEYKWNHTVIEYKGCLNKPDAKSETLQGIILDDKSFVPLDGLFIAIGHTPNTDLIKHLVELDENGYARGIETNVPGLFIAGDVMDPVHKQAVTAAGFGCMAARYAIKHWHNIT